MTTELLPIYSLDVKPSHPYTIKSTDLLSNSYKTPILIHNQLWKSVNEFVYTTSFPDMCQPVYSVHFKDSAATPDEEISLFNKYMLKCYDDIIVKALYDGTRAKVEQHPEIKALLLNSGQGQITYKSDNETLSTSLPAILKAIRKDIVNEDEILDYFIDLTMEDSDDSYDLTALRNMLSKQEREELKQEVQELYKIGKINYTAPETLSKDINIFSDLASNANRNVESLACMSIQFPFKIDGLMFPSVSHYIIYQILAAGDPDDREDYFKLKDDKGNFFSVAELEEKYSDDIANKSSSIEKIISQLKIALNVKFNLPQFRRALLDKKDFDLFLEESSDAILGTGREYSGINVTGKYLTELRDDFIAEMKRFLSYKTDTAIKESEEQAVNLLSILEAYKVENQRDALAILTFTTIYDTGKDDLVHDYIISKSYKDSQSNLVKMLALQSNTKGLEVICNIIYLLKVITDSKIYVVNDVATAASVILEKPYQVPDDMIINLTQEDVHFMSSHSNLEHLTDIIVFVRDDLVKQKATYWSYYS